MYAGDVANSLHETVTFLNRTLSDDFVGEQYKILINVLKYEW